MIFYCPPHQCPNSSSINIIHIHIKTDQKHRQGRFTQFKDLLPLGGQSSSSTPPSSSSNRNQTLPSTSSSLGSPNLSFHSEELLLDLETGEEFHEPYR
ncbi:uncharacterized protein LOC119558284 [Drosophila subpulchrella]|uniref:uncharacterized protein LOC119558284 n=1 Tax=Drosophila subpulchrella TaxID=1486046 RepID=UPI0018A12BA7|nr:uncharacterized protein LOC119558284 [Drosophila subpulchrella]